MSRRLAVFLIALSAAAQKRPVTLADVAAPRPPAAVAWAPGGKQFAFREDNAIWQYDVAAQSKKKIIALDTLRDKAIKGAPAEAFDWQNRRVVESSFQWSGAGDQMLVSAESDLFLVRIDSGEITQLTATALAERDPKLSPDGRAVAFRRGQDLYSLDVASRKETRLTHDGSPTLLNGQADWVYPEELDLPDAYWWSPDSKRIAYLQFDISREPAFPQIDLLAARARFEPEHYPKAGDPNADVRAGVVAATGGATRWLDLGETRDSLIARVDWLPNSQHLAVQRLNRVQSRLDLMLADAAQGTAKLLVREQSPKWINLGNAYRFLKDGKRFLWSSERDGYRHLYLYSIDGKLERALTKGEWEVTALTGVDEESRAVYFTSTMESPLERHLYRAGFDGKSPTRLTSSHGTHTVSMSPTCDYYLDTASSRADPTGRTVHARDGRQLAVFMEPDRKPQSELEILPAEIVKVKASDGAVLYASLIKPAGFVPGKKYPAVVMVYGGPGGQTVRDAWSGVTWDQALAARGYVVWALDNRGTPGRGRDWQFAIFRNLGAKELADQLEGVRYLESLGFIDPARIGIHGWSYGGFMTLYALANAPTVFRAGIAGAPVTDFRNYDTIYTERYMGLPQDNEEGYKSSSVVAKAAQITARLLIAHNFGDDNVHFQNTLQMSDALQRAGKQFEMMIYPQKTHGVTGPARKQMLETFTAFFDDNL